MQTAVTGIPAATKSTRRKPSAVRRAMASRPRQQATFAASSARHLSHAGWLGLLALVSLTSSSLASDGILAISPGANDAFPRTDRGCPTFSWTTAGEASAHELVIVRIEPEWSEPPERERASVQPGPIGSPRHFHLPGGTSTWTPSGADCLEPGERWAWQVRSKSALGNGAWSPVLFFETPPASAAPHEVAEALALLRGFLAEHGDMATDLLGLDSAPASRAARGDAPAALPRDRSEPARAASAGVAAGALFSIGAQGISTSGTVTTSGLLGPLGESFFTVEPTSCGDNSHVVQIAADGAVQCAPDTGDVAAVSAGGGLSGGGTSGTVTLSHANTSSQSSLNGSSGTVLQDITLDTYGHVTALGQADLDLRYFTQATSDGRYVQAGGDSISGSLGIGITPPLAKLHVDGGSDVNLTGGGFVVLGNPTSSSLAIDTNEIMARTNGAGSQLHLQAEGGTVSIGTFNSDETLSVGGSVRLTGIVRRPATSGVDLLPIAYGQVAGNGSITTGSGNFTVTRSVEGKYSIEVAGITENTSGRYVPVGSSTSAVAAYHLGLSASSLSETFVATCWALPSMFLADCSFSFVIYDTQP